MNAAGHARGQKAGSGAHGGDDSLRQGLPLRVEAVCYVHTHRQTYTCTLLRARTRMKRHACWLCVCRYNVEFMRGRNLPVMPSLVRRHANRHEHTHTYVQIHTHTRAHIAYESRMRLHIDTHTHTHDMQEFDAQDQEMKAVCFLSPEYTTTTITRTRTHTHTGASVPCQEPHDPLLCAHAVITWSVKHSSSYCPLGTN